MSMKGEQWLLHKVRSPAGDWSKLPASDVDILVRTKVFSERNAVEVFAHIALVDGVDVEEDDKATEEHQHQHQADPNKDRLPPPVVLAKSHKRQQGIGKQEAKKKANNVGIVVNPWHQTQNEEHQHNCEQLEECISRLFQYLPGVNHFHQETC